MGGENIVAVDFSSFGGNGLAKADDDATILRDDDDDDDDVDLGSVFPKRSNSAQRLGNGASDPLAKIIFRHSLDISLIKRPGDSNFNTKWHSHGGVEPLQ